MSINRVNEFNAECCVSTPQINTTGFINDNFENNQGNCLESRIRTRARGRSSSIDRKLREDFNQLRNEIFKWGESVYNSAFDVGIIERQQNLFHAEIDQQILDVLLGDLSLVGEMASLKDRLSVIWRRARQVSKEQQEESYNPDRSRPAQMTSTNRHPGVELMMNKIMCFMMNQIRENLINRM